jgi:Zn2+/Cd2+-exporting ATPase
MSEQRDHDHSSAGHSHGGSSAPAGSRWVVLSLAASGICTAAALGLQVSGMGSATVIKALAILGIAAGGWILLPGAWAALRRFRPDINLLVVIATVGASVIGEWIEASAVIFLFGVAEWLEGWAERRSRRAVQALLEIAPKTAFVQRGGKFVEVDAEEVKVGELVAVQSGMSVPLDGRITSGHSAINQAPITGESIPVEKKPGDPVFAGTINGEGSLELEVTKLAGDTTLARIIRLVEEAQEQKAPTQRFVDRFAKYYTPLVTVAALLIFIVPLVLFGGDWSIWLYRACVLLIVACPCALVISTPVSIVAALTALARRGVLVKGGAHLETIGKLRALAVDKTGTITEGKPRVRDVVTFNSMPQDEALRRAAAIDAHSSHPLAKAVVEYANERGVTFQRAISYHARTGRGAEAVIDGHPHFVGNHRFAHELGVCTPAVEAALEKIEAQGLSVVVVGHQPHDGCAGEVLGILSVGDAIRDGAKDALVKLHSAGVQQVVMLSGDNQRTADYIAKQVGIDQARGGLLPEDKVGAVKELVERYGIVAMVGDGVNDAPAMASASLGIAMGTTGTDTAIETADITLMKDDLSKIAEAVALGRRAMRIVRFNIAFSLTLKLLFLVLALAGYTSLWLAIVADTGATLLVVANALRLLKVRP